MPPEQNKKAVRALLNAFNTGDVSVIDEIAHPEFKSRTRPMAGLEPTAEGLKKEIKMLREAFPDAEFKEEDMIAEGEKVYVRWTMTGTHAGAPILGRAANRKKITHQGQEFLRFAHNKIVERHGEEHELEFAQKLA